MIISKPFLTTYTQMKLNTGKSLSESLLFAEHGENMLCTKIVLNVRNNFCIQHVLPRFELGIFMYWTCNSMNNLLSHCGLVSKNKFFRQRFTCNIKGLHRYQNIFFAISILMWNQNLRNLYQIIIFLFRFWTHCVTRWTIRTTHYTGSLPFY